jgi:hypothetical protein
MKPQDIIFLILLLFFLYKRKPQWLVAAGLSLLILSMPLFHFWIFFTASRFVYYAFLLFLISAILLLSKKQ